ncbi:MAG: sulfurtransferase FdhD [Bacteroidetes bacterium B1(2017)]|nr:MAG: sulfurtransferase FdhD [Bacteroidetes bacterium B1(2017)]
MNKPAVAATRLMRIENGEVTYKEDLLAVEEPLEIRLGFGSKENRQQKKISVTMRTPGNDFELALGFLFTEGIVKNSTEISSIQYCTELNTLENNFNIVRVELNENVDINLDSIQRNFYTTSSCGVCGKASIEAVFQQCDKTEKELFLVASPLLLSLPKTLQEHQQVFTYTGGLHGCALFSKDGNFILSREDVGRHNALDKLIGAILGSNQNQFKESILLLSGRASFELLQKAAMAGISLVAAVGAPSSLAVDLAKENDITLIGFLRDNRFNVYCGEKRILA